MKKRRNQMNLRGFQVFEAVARHLSVTEAAEELGVTQSAASHQLRKLSEAVGEKLIERRGRNITLTDAGRKLAASLDNAFDLIERSARSAVGGSRAMVRLGLYSSFAVGVIIPALPAFLEANPDLDLRLVMLHDPHDVSGHIADVFITSEPVRIGYWAMRLFTERLVPVVVGTSPANFDRPLRLITAEVEPGIAGRDWEAFAVLKGQDIGALRSGSWLCCSHYILALDLVRAGLGAALLPDFMVRTLLLNGELRRLPGPVLPTGLTYDVQVKYERRNEPDIVRFINWLKVLLRGQTFDA